MGSIRKHTAIACGCESHNLFSILEFLHSPDCRLNDLMSRLQRLLNFNAAIIYLDCGEPQSVYENAPVFDVEASYGLDDQFVEMFRKIERVKLTESGPSSNNQRSIYLWKDLSNQRAHLPEQLSVLENENGISSSYHPGAGAYATKAHFLFSKSSLVSDTHLSIVSKLMPHINQVLIKERSSQIKRHYSELFTRREREVFNWVKAGKSAYETAIIIGVSERTIKFHLRNIYQKLNVTSKTQAIVKGFEVGLFEHARATYFN